jgi:hypothetical protein
MDPFHELVAPLVAWRVRPEIRLMEAAKEEGRVLDFVKGLRLSSRVIYALRETVGGRSDLDVNWGHLLDEQQRSCSPECDIIIHRRGHGQVARWNGNKGGRVMDFVFIEASSALAVVSCKSSLDAIRAKEKAYCKAMKGYVQKVFLLVECCAGKAVAALDRAATRAGYDAFCHLYTLDPGSHVCVPNEPGWQALAELVLALGKRRQR